MQTKYGAKGLAVVSVSNDSSDEEAGAFAKEIKATFPVIRDTEGKIYALYQAEAVPANLVIDRKGKIVFSRDAGADLKAMEAAIGKALAGASSAPAKSKIKSKK